MVIEWDLRLIKFEKKILKIFVFVLISTVLFGCNLHLRGYEGGNSGDLNEKWYYQNIQLVGDNQSLLYRILSAKLNTLPSNLVEVPDSNTLIIVIGEPEIKVNAVSVDSNSQELEYMIFISTKYSFRTIDENKSYETRTVSHYKNYLNKTNEIIASNNESNLLKEQLIKRIAEDIYLEVLKVNLL